MVSNPNGYDALPYLLAANTMIIGTTVADGLITGFTCFYFLKQSRIARFSGTKELLARLIAVSMQSAAPPLICALIHLVFNFRFQEHDGIWVNFFNMLMPYLYVISLLFTLNSRPKYWAGGESRTPDEANTHGQRSIPLRSSDHQQTEQNEHCVTEVYISATNQTQQDVAKLMERREA
ncbi:hypothetical protein FS749_002614 [Ceratobasidium sp. UAMH 11750]|nr:hypothetical protein FS749_002614 [Ceratobasidium sp. UAMH 11750]